MNTVYITILSALLSNSVAPSSATECSEKWTIDYISNESQKAYSESVDCFFGTFAKSIAKINKNKRNEDLRKILTLGLKVVGNAEVTEAWSKFVENLVINDSIFFLDAVILTDKKHQIFISNALKSPLFMEAKDIRSKITPYSKLNKYKSFFGLYGSRK